ncbi:MAG TPA: SHOCT domain-containing protein [Nitrososphaera sp.]
MMIIVVIITTLYAATLFFLAPTFVAKAYAQEDSNSSNNTLLILEDMRSIMRDQQRDIASIRNTSSVEAEALTEMAMSSSRLAIQGAYTALSVFFLGIGLVIFGLRLTTRSSPQIGRYFTIMVWALTVPVIILIGLFQYGAITGSNVLASIRGEEPYFVLTFLMYIPAAILVFVLLAQHRIMHAQAPQVPGQGKKDPHQELERLGSLKQQGLITEEEFQKLKTRLLSGV